MGAEEVVRETSAASRAEVECLDSAIALASSRLAAERKEKGSRLLVGAHRFSPSDFEKLAFMYNSDAYTGPSIAALVQRWLAPPRSPPPDAIHVLESMNAGPLAQCDAPSQIGRIIFADTEAKLEARLLGSRSWKGPSSTCTFIRLQFHWRRGLSA